MTNNTNHKEVYKATNQSLRMFALKLLKVADSDLSRDIVNEMVFSDTKTVAQHIIKALNSNQTRPVQQKLFAEVA